MAVLFGDTRRDGKIRVWQTLHRVQGKEVEASKYPEGYEFVEMPEPPTPEPGIDHIWLYDPKTGQHSFETQERPWTQEELVEHKLPDLERRIKDLEDRLR